MNANKRKPVQKFKSQYQNNGFKPEIFDGLSMTTPNESLSVRQLLINHTRGLGTVSTREGIYTEDQVAPKYTDILDRHNALQDLKNRIESAKADIEKEKAHKDLKSSALSSDAQVHLNDAPESEER